MGVTALEVAEEVTQAIDAAGLTAIVTGASSGIGAETTRVLALRGVHVIMELDLSSLASVRKFASDFTARALPLNILM
ncbi:hypothetical protein WN943_028035 [Citrus x changshan-huyou]